MAAESKSLDKVEKDVIDLEAMLSESDSLRALIVNPLIGRGEQRDVIMALADKAKFQKLTKHFLGMMAENRRLNILSALVEMFAREMIKRRGEISAAVETAHPLTAAQTKALQAELKKAVGSDVTLDVKVNEELIGGMIVTVGSLMIDDSVRHKIERMGRDMARQDAA